MAIVIEKKTDTKTSYIYKYFNRLVYYQHQIDFNITMCDSIVKDKKKMVNGKMLFAKKHHLLRSTTLKNQARRTRSYFIG